MDGMGVGKTEMDEVKTRTRKRRDGKKTAK